jgi:hypothetical protein
MQLPDEYATVGFAVNISSAYATLRAPVHACCNTLAADSSPLATWHSLLM